MRSGICPPTLAVRSALPHGSAVLPSATWLCPPDTGRLFNGCEDFGAHGLGIATKCEDDAGEFEQIDPALAIFKGGNEGLGFPQPFGEVGLCNVDFVAQCRQVCPDDFVMLGPDPHAALSQKCGELSKSDFRISKNQIIRACTRSPVEMGPNS